MRLVFAALMALCPGTGATAQSHDPQVVQALNEMAWAFGVNCQHGHAQACQSANDIQSYGGQMLQAGTACHYGNRQACQIQEQACQELSGVCGQFQ